MKKVFISHPYIDDPDRNILKVNKICKDIIRADEGIIPLSPIHMFEYIDTKDEEEYREEIMEICYSLISIADEIWIYYYNPTSPLNISDGQKRELYDAIYKEKLIVFKEGII
jgi:hypothetical protein